MKRAVLAVFYIIALSSLGLAMKTGTARAYKDGYDVTDYVAQITPTMDGTWTTPDEWTDAAEKQLDGSLNATFRLKYDSSYPDWVNQYYLIEFFDDTTNDAGDYWQICYASAAELMGTPIGGTTPQTDCDRFDFVGHNATGLTIYIGTGTAWVETTDYTTPTDIEIVDTISASPLDSNPHWIAEIKIEHIHFTIQPEFWIRIAAYDESSSGAGVQAWPAGSADVPDDWGLMNASQDPIPEGLSIGVVVLLTSVAVLIASRVRKWSRTESRGAGKREK
jgi:hypothetical protein